MIVKVAIGYAPSRIAIFTDQLHRRIVHDVRRVGLLLLPRDEGADREPAGAQARRLDPDPFCHRRPRGPVARQVGRLRTSTIQRNRPALLVEAEERHHPNAVAEITALLADLGYRGYFIEDGAQRSIAEFDADRHQDPANIGGWKDGWSTQGVYVNNFVFVPQDS